MCEFKKIFTTMTRLSVNINKIATLRNARGGNNPNVVKVAKDCEKFGAEGITVHPRPDERHITQRDVYDLKEVVTTEFNIEGYPDQRFMDMLKEVKPDQATLVPDPPEAITSSTGWDTVKHQSFLSEIIGELKSHGIRTSIFLNPVPKLIDSAQACGTDRIELYTEPYASLYKSNKKEAIAPYIETAALAHKAGLDINAGHDLDLDNVSYFVESIPTIKEVSIGHALICDAIYLGLANTIQFYLRQLDVS